MIEVADSSLGMDMGKKGQPVRLFRDRGVLGDQPEEGTPGGVPRTEPDSEAVFGASYREVRLDPDASIRPVNFPHIEVSVRQLLEPT